MEPDNQDKRTKADGKDGQVPILARSVVHVQRPGCETRVKAQVLGAVPDAYIVLRDLPLAGRSESKLSTILPMTGDTVLVRFLHEGVVFGFRSAVARVVTEPEYLLFVQYPKCVERFSVREQRRWVCSIPCRLEVSGQSGPAIMTNINSKACGVAALVQDESISPKTDDAVGITLRVPESDHALNVSGKVRRIEASDRVWQAGILFEEDQEQMMEAVMPYLAIEAER